MSVAVEVGLGRLADLMCQTGGSPDSTGVAPTVPGRRRSWQEREIDSPTSRRLADDYRTHVRARASRRLSLIGWIRSSGCTALSPRGFVWFLAAGHGRLGWWCVKPTCGGFWGVTGRDRLVALRRWVAWRFGYRCLRLWTWRIAEVPTPTRPVGTIAGFWKSSHDHAPAARLHPQAEGCWLSMGLIGRLRKIVAEVCRMLPGCGSWSTTLVRAVMVWLWGGRAEEPTGAARYGGRPEEPVGSAVVEQGPGLSSGGPGTPLPRSGRPRTVRGRPVADAYAQRLFAWTGCYRTHVRTV